MKRRLSITLGKVSIRLCIIALCVGFSITFLNNTSSFLSEIPVTAKQFSQIKQDIKYPGQTSFDADTQPHQSKHVNNEIHLNLSGDVKLATPISCSWRYLSLVQFTGESLQAEYRLAFEILVPPILLLEKKYKVQFSPSLNWMLSDNSTPSRLNAWKETNIIYRKIQQA